MNRIMNHSLKSESIVNNQNFEEIPTKDFPDSLVFKLERGKTFGNHQDEKIKAISRDCYNGITTYFDSKHIIFSFPDDPDSALFLCLAKPEVWDERDGFPYLRLHDQMWFQLKKQFGEDLLLKDAGEYCIYEGEHIIGSYVSKNLSEGTHEITPEECFATRAEITNMNIGITVREN
jgi:hypothetical protein